MHIFSFVFFQNFAISQLWGCWFQIWQYSLKFYQKSKEMRHIWSQIYELLFLFKVLEFDKSEYRHFKYENSYLKFYQKNIQTTYFCIFSVLYFFKILQFDKFEGADFKYSNTLSNSTKKVKKWGIFDCNFMRFCFCLKF